ncbi:hypothetical protein OnM2_022021 [Erysiphe neolycopersici]|uniref:Uncharacterized protein n=1 Tax=Erysiphe neolycopersici TaxID=212602 RepID=A0A420I2I2_9PEZI|nr:hypothetical protein OnM2_022021 [Erysiphe neolycopersici]
MNMTKLYDSGSDPEWNVIDVVVEGLEGNLLRCKPLGNNSEEPPLMVPNNLSESIGLLQPGYFCGNIYFSYDYLQKSA